MALLKNMQLADLCYATFSAVRRPINPSGLLSAAACGLEISADARFEPEKRLTLVDIRVML